MLLEINLNENPAALNLFDSQAQLKYFNEISLGMKIITK